MPMTRAGTLPWKEWMFLAIWSPTTGNWASAESSTCRWKCVLPCSPYPRKVVRSSSSGNSDTTP